MHTIKINEGVNLHIYNSNKYKDVTITLNYYAPIEKKRNIYRNIMAYLITDKSKKYPSKTLLNEAKDDLYGASIGTSCSNVVRGNVLKFGINVLNNEFAHQDNVYEGIKLLKEVLYNPIIDENSFEEAKMNLIDYCNRRKDKPSAYSVSRILQIYGENHELSLKSIIDEDDIKNADIKTFEAYFNEMLNEDQLDIFITGKVDENKIINDIKEIFNFKKHHIYQYIPNLVEGFKYQKIEEYKDIDQCCLVMLFKSNVDVNTDEYLKLVASNCFFGVVPNSLLFQGVREQKSLCYSIGSNVYGSDGLLMVKTLIDQKNQEQVIESIMEEYNKIIEGNFEFEQFKQAMNLYIDVLNGMSDDRKATVNFDYDSIILGHFYNIDYMIEKMMEMNKEDIINVFKKLELKMTYVLKRNEDD